jgi:hypothetical protein
VHRLYDGRTLSVSHISTRIYWYNQSSQRLRVFGSCLLHRTKDFDIRKALAWKACILLVKIWKSNCISSAVKIKSFRACVGSILQYNAVPWTLTDTLPRKLDGCYTKLLRYALNHKWSSVCQHSTTGEAT